MFKKLFLAIFLVFFIFTPKAFTTDEFATSYDVVYDVGSDGATSLAPERCNQVQS